MKQRWNVFVLVASASALAAIYVAARAGVWHGWWLAGAALAGLAVSGAATAEQFVARRATRAQWDAIEIEDPHAVTSRRVGRTVATPRPPTAAEAMVADIEVWLADQ